VKLINNRVLELPCVGGRAKFYKFQKLFEKKGEIIAKRREERRPH
jgi:hypothetical protein